MKFAVVLIFMLGAASANPILHKVAMEMIDHASNSTSSESESSEQSNSSEHDSSQENTSENNTSESLESISDDQTSDMSQSHSLEARFGTGEAGITTDNSQGSLENMRKSWVHLVTVKLVSEEDKDTDEVTDQPDTTEDLLSESSESTESQEKETQSSSSSSTESESSKDSRVDVDSSENSESQNNSSSSSSSSSESQESSHSTESTESAESRSKVCQPGAHSDECDSEEYGFHDIGDDGTNDPFNGFHNPDNTDHEVLFKR